MRTAIGIDSGVSAYASRERDWSAMVQYVVANLASSASETGDLAPIDVSRSSVFLSFAGGFAGDFNALDDALCTATLAPTQITFERGTSEDIGGSVHATVVQWP